MAGADIQPPPLRETHLPQYDLALPWRGLNQLALADALLLGFAQAAAIIPGISRSGATITLGLARGLHRPVAARATLLVGFIAIGWLLRYLQRAPMTIYIIYRCVMGVALIGAVLLS